MPSRGISRLAMPPEKYSPAILLSKFEQHIACVSENSLRSKRLQTYRKSNYPAARLYPISEAKALAERLQLVPTDPSQASLACSESMRQFRNRVCGWATALQAETIEFSPTTFTVASRAWEIPAHELRQFHPQTVINGFLTDINRAGGLEEKGYLLAFLHSELVNEDRYRMHLHGMCTPDFVKVLDRIRLRSKYYSPPEARPSIHIRRKPISNVPYALSYLLKSYWPGMYEGPVGDDGLIGRQSRVRRINEPHHSNVLLWMDQWRLEDITLLKNLRISGGGLGFQPTKLYSHLNDGKYSDMPNLPIHSSGMRF